jgi:hypothetical protein
VLEVQAAKPTFSWTGELAPADPGYRDIARLNHIASKLGSVHPGPPISFETLLLAFFAARDPFSRWLQRRREAPELLKRIADAARFSLDEVRAAGSAAATTMLPGVLWTMWAAKVGEEAHAIATRILGREPTSMGPEHFFAAFCFGAVGHHEELAAWQFDRTDWTQRLLAWIAVRRPQELRGWLGVVGEKRVIDDRLILGARWNARGERDVSGVLDHLATASDSAFAKLVQARGWTIDPPPVVTGLPSELERSSELDRWLDLAQVMAFPADAIADIDLLAAAVAAPPGALPSVVAWFDARGTSFEVEAPEIWRWALSTSALSGADHHLHSAGRWTQVRDIWTEMDAPRLSGFNNDEARGGEDRLDFKRDVAALAQLLAANAEHGITPPLSVGLFGDWGTGKTFFMDMLEKQIEQLRTSGEAAFCERIVQIRFNAWHYMDANLWASLATHLFGDLDRQLARGETDEQREARVKQQLASSRAEIDRLDREKKSLETQLTELRKQAVAAETTRRDRRLELADLRAVDVKAVLAANPDLAAKMRKLDEAARTASTVRAFFGRYTIGFLAVTFAAVAIGLYAGRAVLSQLASAIGGLLAIGAGVVGAVRRAIPRSEELVTLFVDIEARARARPSEDEDRIGKEIAAADLRYQELVGACSRLATDVARLEADKRQIADGRNFTNYVLQRNQSDDYRKQLGIVSTLQRDFDELSRRLLVDDGGTRVQRIVLYIDDLDRCPADKVVQVLQAIHLLLSFPLFVVVVAVDPRWVLRSLEEHYARQMGGDGEARIPAATPHAYLEKIFQISVRVRQMGTTSYGRLIDGLAGNQLPRPDAEPGNGERKVGDGMERDVGRRDAGNRVPGRDGMERDASEQEEASAASSSNGDSASSNGDSASSAARAALEVPGPELTGEALTLEPYEVEYLKLLGELVPSPRAAKRLINVYRLIRVQLTPAERLRFVREHDGTFHAVMVFLALNARFPSQALELFDRVIDASPPPKNWPDLRARLAHEHGHDPGWDEMWTAFPPVLTTGESSFCVPLTNLRWNQLRAAAELAVRYSLPGARANREG